MRRHVAPVALALTILAATLLFAWKLIFTGLVVIGYDTMAYMYPYRAFAAEALRDGRIPSGTRGSTSEFPSSPTSRVQSSIPCTSCSWCFPPPSP